MKLGIQAHMAHSHGDAHIQAQAHWHLGQLTSQFDMNNYHIGPRTTGRHCSSVHSIVPINCLKKTRANVGQF